MGEVVGYSNRRGAVRTRPRLWLQDIARLQRSIQVVVKHSETRGRGHARLPHTKSCKIILRLLRSWLIPATVLPRLKRPLTHLLSIKQQTKSSGDLRVSGSKVSHFNRTRQEPCQQMADKFKTMPAQVLTQVLLLMTYLPSTDWLVTTQATKIKERRSQCLRASCTRLDCWPRKTFTEDWMTLDVCTV